MGGARAAGPVARAPVRTQAPAPQAQPAQGQTPQAQAAPAAQLPAAIPAAMAAELATLVATPLSPEQVRAQAQSQVFQLITRVRGGEDKRSYGTAFVVSPEGWLLTNFHVVAEALTDPVHYALDLQLPDKSSLPAQIEAYDIPNDLTLVRVNHTFSSSYRLAAHPLVPGEKLYSLGLPQDTVMTIVEGLYSDTGRMGPLTRSLMSAPLNHGMSGGPVVNTMNDLVGVNDAILPNAQSISLLVPAQAISDFLQRSTGQRASAPSTREPAAVSSALTDGIPEQIGNALRPWLAEWRTQLSGTQTGIALGPYRIAPPPPDMKCWEDMKSGSTSSSEHGDSRGRVCSSMSSFPILPGKIGGQMTLRYLSYGESTTPTPARDANILEKLGLGRFFAADLFVDSTLRKASTRFAASAKPTGDGASEVICHHRFLRNRHGVELVAEYCLSAEHPLNGVYDLVLTATPIGDVETMIAELDLNGFTGPELLNAGETFLDGISTNGHRAGAVAQ